MLDNVPSIPTTVLRMFVGFLIQSNDLLSWLNPWITTPSLSGENREFNVTVHPIITTLSYACLEPLLTRELLQRAAPPWSLLWVLPPSHLALSLNSILIYTGLSGIALSRSRADPTEWSRERPLFKLCAALTLMMPVVSSAVINATLLLFHQSLYEASMLHRPTILPWTAVFIFLVCRFGDYRICRQTFRGRSLGSTILFQLILFTTRACVRGYVGLSPWFAFQIPEASEATEKFGSQRYLWIEAGRKHYLFVTALALSLATIPLTILGHHLLFPGLVGRSTQQFDDLDEMKTKQTPYIGTRTSQYQRADHDITAMKEERTST